MALTSKSVLLYRANIYGLALNMKFTPIAIYVRCVCVSSIYKRGIYGGGRRSSIYKRGRFSGRKVYCCSNSERQMLCVMSKAVSS